MDGFRLGDLLRRIRRLADCSQRELADRVGASKTAIAGAESGTRDLPVSVLVRAAGSVGGRLVVLDASGSELVPMDGGAVRDAGGRLFPAHLDTRHGDDSWWGGEHRPRTRQPDYTFDLDRDARNGGDGMRSTTRPTARGSPPERCRRRTGEPGAPASPGASTPRARTPTCPTRRAARAAATSTDALLP